jgi:hypothetical protein
LHTTERKKSTTERQNRKKIPDTTEVKRTEKTESKDKHNRKTKEQTEQTIWQANFNPRKSRVKINVVF